jgi:hypothetical protein
VWPLMPPLHGSRDVIEPHFDVPAFFARQNKMDGDYLGGAGHKQEKRK